MPDSHRHDISRLTDGESAIERERKTEALLLAGLDQYFAGQYEQAVNVWTRVLFFDRRHARALAYIERARSAMAERLRESEELLSSSAAALGRGETAAARRLLTSAVDRGGMADEALVLLERLNRLEAAGGHVTTVSPRFRGLRRRSHSENAGNIPKSRRRLVPVLLLAVVWAATLVVAASWDQIEPLLLRLPAAPAVAPPNLIDERLAVPTRADFTISRARALFRRGHLHEALRLLNSLQPSDALRSEADALRATIQRTLLTGVGPGTALDRPGVADRSAGVP